MGENPDQKWHSFDFSGTGTWPQLWPAVAFRLASPAIIELRLLPPDIAMNRLGGLHGAFLAGVAENCLCLFLYDVPGRDGVTISLSLDYPAGGMCGVEIQGELELIRETGRMQFLRITLRQDDVVLLHGSGVVRKVDTA